VRSWAAYNGREVELDHISNMIMLNPNGCKTSYVTVSQGDLPPSGAVSVLDDNNSPIYFVRGVVPRWSNFIIPGSVKLDSNGRLEAAHLPQGGYNEVATFEILTMDMCIEQTKVIGSNIRFTDGSNYQSVISKDQCLDFCGQYEDCKSIEYNDEYDKCQINSREIEDTDPKGLHSRWLYCPRR